VRLALATGPGRVRGGHPRRPRRPPTRSERACAAPRGPVPVPRGPLPARTGPPRRPSRPLSVPSRPRAFPRRPLVVPGRDWAVLRRRRPVPRGPLVKERRPPRASSRPLAASRGSLPTPSRPLLRPRGPLRTSRHPLVASRRPVPPPRRALCARRRHGPIPTRHLGTVAHCHPSLRSEDRSAPAATAYLTRARRSGCRGTSSSPIPVVKTDALVRKGARWLQMDAHREVQGPPHPSTAVGSTSPRSSCRPCRASAKRHRESRTCVDSPRLIRTRVDANRREFDDRGAFDLLLRHAFPSEFAPFLDYLAQSLAQ
jgi:hypothetical protein